MHEKIKASLYHFLFSIILTGSALGLILSHFYPSVFFEIENPYDALKVLIPADIIIGPVLTFIIYKKGKSGLKFDLTVIIICQLIAMSYGCWTIYKTRPGFLVFHGDTFYIVPPKIEQLSLAGTGLEVGSFDSPQIAYLFLPGDPNERFILAMKSAAAGIPVHWQAQYFKNFKEIDNDKLTKKSLDIEELYKKSNKKQSIALDTLYIPKENYVFIPVIGTHSEKIIVINLTSKIPAGTLNISPF